MDSPVVQEILIAIGLVLVSGITHLILKRYVLQLLYKAFCQTKHQWDQILFEKGVFNNLPYLIPAIILYQGVEFLPAMTEPARRIISVWIVVIFLGFISKLLTGLQFIYESYPIAKKRPIKGYVQIVKLLMLLSGGIVAISILTDQSPWFFLSGLGALTAVLMLIFRDTILSFIASLQIMGNDLVRVGDWVEMPKYDADGAVIEIALHTVKIQNWDNTITMLPTYKLIEDSFRNWRGMSESGGRRIMRSILIDQSSIKFCDQELLTRLEKIHLLKDYISQKQQEITEYNRKLGVDDSTLVNGRRMTNVGTFRAYVNAYLAKHPHVHKGMISMVRQLQPTTEGLPLQIYVFTNDVAWVNYENIQSDIFDHILAVVSEFDLRIYQKPTGHDVTQLAQITTASY